jgi:hypothetical protein
MTREQTQSTSNRRDSNGGEREQSDLSDKTHEVAEQVRAVALDRVDSMRQSTQSAKNQAAERIRKLGATVRKVGEHLRVEDQHYVAEKASDASQRLENLANYVSSAELGALVRDTSALARKSPAVFFGGAFVIGLAAGRFLKTTGSTGSSGTAESPDRSRVRSERERADDSSL